MKPNNYYRLISLALIVALSAIARGSGRSATGQEHGQTARPANDKRVARVSGDRSPPLVTMSFTTAKVEQKVISL
jgi:hypothetical protein